MDFPERPRPGRQPARKRQRPKSPAPETGETGAVPAVDAAHREEGASPSPGRSTRGPTKPERIRRGRSETLVRVLWAIPAIALAVTVTVIGGEVFAAAMILLAVIGMIELFRMTRRARPFALVAFGAAAGMIVAAQYGSSFHMVLAGVVFFPVMLAFAASRESLRHVTYSMAVTVFAIVWIALPFAHAVLLRGIPEYGAGLLVNVLVATFLADTCAYLGGRMFGSRPLAPMISPNKTVEGLAIGVVGGTLGFWFAGLYQDWLSGADALLMGFCIALIAPLGDLFESMIKRDLDVKDSGTLFGPHGGVLDRLDAVLFTVVAGYYLSLAIVV